MFLSTKIEFVRRTPLGKPGTLLFLLVLLASCKPSTQVDIVYYPVDSLVSAQIKYLSKDKAGLSKQSFVDGRSDSTSYVPADSVAWKNELDVFASLNVINKSISKDAYRISDGLNDANSNLTIRQFDATKEELPVRRLRIFYHGNIRNIRRIEGLYREDNQLYTSTRNFSAELREINNKTVLTSYSIRGSQKMILADSMQFSIRGKIQYKSTAVNGKAKQGASTGERQEEAE